MENFVAVFMNLLEKTENTVLSLLITISSYFVFLFIKNHTNKSKLDTYEKSMRIIATKTLN